MSDAVVIAAISGFVSILTAAIVVYGQRKLQQAAVVSLAASNRVEALVNGHSTVQTNEIKELNSRVAFLTNHIAATAATAAAAVGLVAASVDSPEPDLLHDDEVG